MNVIQFPRPYQPQSSDDAGFWKDTCAEWRRFHQSEMDRMREESRFNFWWGFTVGVGLVGIVLGVVI